MGIGIAEKSHETRRDRWGGNVNHKSLHFKITEHVTKDLCQNRDLWFTLPPQRSLLVSWLFSAIPIPILNFQFFIHLYYLNARMTVQLEYFVILYALIGY